MVKGLGGLLLVAAVAAAGNGGDIEFILDHNLLHSNPPASTSRFTAFEVSEMKLGALGLIRLYQLFVSSQDLPVCNFTPSCSRFGMSSIRRYGLVQGLLMTSDRLQRCNGLGAPYYPLDAETGKCFDPPEQELPW